MNNLYKLLIYLKVNENSMALVDSFISNSKEELEQEAQHRLANNSHYVCIVMTYSLEAANIVEKSL